MAKEENLDALRVRIQLLSAVSPDSSQSWVDQLNKDFREYVNAMQGREAEIQREETNWRELYEEVRGSNPTFTLQDGGERVVISGV